MALSGVALEDLVETALEQYRDNVGTAYTDASARTATLEALNILLINRAEISKVGTLTEVEFASFGSLRDTLQAQVVAVAKTSTNRRSFVRGKARLV